MNTLRRYIEVIVDPTYEDFKKNSGSARHAFLTCTAIFHAIDRLPNHENLRKIWEKQSFDFAMVDVIAHHFKHVVSNDEKNPRGLPGMPIGNALGFNEAGDEMDLRNIYFLIRDAVKFLHEQAVLRE